MDIVRTLLYICLLWVVISAKNTCTSLDNLDVTRGKLLPNSNLLNLTTGGIMSCSRACLMRTMCFSFNYNEDTGNCQLNNRTMTSSSDLVDANNYVFSDISNWPSRLAGSCAEHLCPLNLYCGPVDGFLYSCVITGCLGLPRLDHGRFDTSPDYSSVGTNISLTCHDDYHSTGNVVCQENGTWSDARCVLVTSCSIVKKLQPDSEDGEYWVILPNLDNYRTRIYCHDMASSTPFEYLSLRNTNHGIYPQVSKRHCGPEAILACTGLGGKIWFSKIRVDIQTMKVQLDDLTFANVSNVADNLEYGTAHDCYAAHPNGQLLCGVKGEFTIDLRRTGWRIREEQEWELYGYQPYMMPVDRQRNGTLIYLNCGGFSGGCTPKNGLFLTPFQDDMNVEK